MRRLKSTVNINECPSGAAAASYSCFDARKIARFAHVHKFQSAFTIQMRGEFLGIKAPEAAGRWRVKVLPSPSTLCTLIVP